MIPQTLILLANLGRARRPGGAPAPHSEPVLPDPTTAGEQLAPLLSAPVTEADLPALRRLHQLAVEGAESLLAGEPPDCAAITALAHDSTAHLELTATDGGLRQDLVWSDSSISSGLARRLIEARRARAQPAAPLRPHRVRPAFLRHHPLAHTPLARRRPLRLETTPAPPPHPPLINSGAAICGDADGRRRTAAIAPMVIRVGGTSLARSVHDQGLLGPEPRGIAHERAGSLPPTPISRTSAC